MTTRALTSLAFLAALALLAVATGCGVHGLSFKQDKRVDIVSPDDRSEVRLPVRLRWQVRDFDVGPGTGSFGVLVDQAPPPSGKTLAWLFRGERGCKSRAAACSTPQFLAQRRAFRTTATALTLDQVPRLSGSQATRQFHEATVVLLDGSGKRVGEGAWSVQFEVKGEDR